MPERMLPLYLWDLRAQVEAQLRLLTDAQRLVDALPTASQGQRAAHVARVLKNLTEIVNANAAIRDVAAAALQSAQEFEAGATR